MWVSELLLSILGILSFMVVGLLVDYYLLTKRTLNFNLATFFALGLGAVVILQMALSLAGIPVNSTLVFAVSSLAILLVCVNHRLRIQLTKSVLQNLRKLNSRNVLVILVLVVLMAIVALVTFSHPVWGYDAISRWLATANAFWADQGITRANLHGSYILDDPQLWPLAISWFFHFLGKTSDFWVQAIPFAVLACLIGEFARKVLTSGWIGLGFLVILVFSPYLWGTVISASYSGNADLLVSFYFLLAFGALFTRRFVYSAIFFGFAALTKNDAAPALVGFCIVLPMFGILFGQKIPHRGFLTAVGFLVLNLAWKAYFDLNSRYLQSDYGAIWASRPIVEYTKYSLHAFREEFRFVERWGIGFFVIFFFLISRVREIFREKLFLAGLLLFGCQLVGYIWVYYVTREDQASQIATSIFRLVLQVYPALLLFAFVLFANMLKFPHGRK